MSGKVSEITQLASERSGLKKGDRVMALVGGGGYAGMCVCACECVCVCVRDMQVCM